ncbi:MAG: SGNH/GDSL hydrolase family protein, partial [Candidatus Moraniibacteriota bacterium]
MKTKLLLGSTFILVSLFCFQFSAAQASSGAKKVLFIGDSITRSGPTPDIGWSGDYGMAATSASNDYAHLLYAKIAGAQTSTPALTVQGSYNGKIAGALSALSSLAAVGADLVVIQIGENDIDLTKDQFESQYESLAAGLKNATSGVRLYCVSAWKDSAERGGRDASIRKICERQGGIFVDISAIANNPIYSALAEGHFTHDGINWHPGNAGMQAYADTLWGVMKNALQDPVQNPTETCYPDLSCQASTCTNSTCKETKCGWELNGTKVCGNASETCSGDGGCLAYKPDYANEVAGTCAEGLKCYDCFSGRFNGSGCDSVKCNGDCTGDTYECDDGLICYNKKCRKPTNPDDATCSGTAVPGNPGSNPSPDDGCIEAFQPFYCANLWITGDAQTYHCCKTPTPPQSGCECSGNPGDPFSAIIYCPSGQTCQNCQCVASTENPAPAPAPVTPSLSVSPASASGPAPLDVNFTLTNGTGCINYMCGVGFGASEYEYEKSFRCTYPTAGTYLASIECAGSKIEKTISVTDSGAQNPTVENNAPDKPTVSPTSGTNFTVSPGEFGMVTITSNNASSIFHTLKYTTDGSTPADPSIPVTTSAEGSFVGYNGSCSGCDHYGISLSYRGGLETKYKILVKAKNSYGDSPVSDVFSYSVKNNASPENPTSPTCTASFSASTTSVGVSSLSLTAPATAYLNFNSSGADKLMVSCSGQFPLTPAVEVPPSYSNYPFPFSATQTGTETCTFVPYKNGVAGTTSCQASVIVSKPPTPTQPTGTCECSANSPFSGGSSCASGTTCDGCHCIASSTAV